MDRALIDPPKAPGRVLPTLNPDGTRRRIRPKLYRGRTHRARLVVGWALMALFAGIPFVKTNGKPLIFLDLPSREFTLFGSTFLATDGVLLMLLMLSILLGVFWLTALVGRGWCGWACPQTVYMEFLFRPIERLFEGDRASQLRIDRNGGSRRRLAKNAVFLLLSFVVANVFLAYFVSVDTLAEWMTRSPFEHPGPFLVMAATAGLVFFDFGYFREQMCTVACPYARLQSVLLDPNSLVVGYDRRRGEPRGHGKPKPGQGDCIGCNACVTTCPTGIDIREGLQLECIACAQCVDACDSIMAKVQKPLGLIRYASENSLAGKKTRVVRPRVVAYGIVVTILVAALIVVGSLRDVADVTVLRGIGAPFVVSQDGVRNQLRIKVENRTDTEQSFDIKLEGVPEARLVAPENPLVVPGGHRRTTSVFVVAPQSAFRNGARPVEVRITTEDGFDETVSYRLLGPTDPRARGNVR